MQMFMKVDELVNVDQMSIHKRCEAYCIHQRSYMEWKKNVDNTRDCSGEAGYPSLPCHMERSEFLKPTKDALL